MTSPFSTTEKAETFTELLDLPSSNLGPQCHLPSPLLRPHYPAEQSLATLLDYSPSGSSDPLLPSVTFSPLVSYRKEQVASTISLISQNQPILPTVTTHPLLFPFFPCSCHHFNLPPTACCSLSLSPTLTLTLSSNVIKNAVTKSSVALFNCQFCILVSQTSGISSVVGLSCQLD